MALISTSYILLNQRDQKTEAIEHISVKGFSLLSDISEISQQGFFDLARAEL